MTLFQEFIQDAIKIDFDSEIVYGQDQVYVSYPIVFPTVTFQLKATPMLEQIAERLNLDLCDFTLGINGYSDSHVDSVLYITPEHSIDLTPEEQNALYDCLDEQCWSEINKGCEELLEEARENIHD